MIGQGGWSQTVHELTLLVTSCAPTEHVSLNTTNIYAEIDLEMKAKALAHCEVSETKPVKRWREDAGLMEFLHSI